jgi:hypothetical protein
MHRASSTKEQPVANHNHNGGREGPLDDQRESWRPQDRAPMSDRNRRDDDDRSWRDRNYRDDDRRMSDRDPRRWEGGRGSELGHHEDRDPSWRSTERYGQGQSGYGAGRHGEDRSQQRMQNRNELGGVEDRHDDLGVDDRFTSRHGGYWLDRPVRDEHAARSGRSHDERVGEPGASQRRTGYSTYGQAGQGQSGYGRHQATQDDLHRSGGHTHHGTGPHRGRGPAGYQRSDERIREAVCESLTEDDAIDATHIDVSVRGGEVTLTGVVEDRRAKRDAEDCAYSVAGVRDVQNLLRVRDDDRSARTSSFPHGNHGHGSHGAVGTDIDTLQDGRKPRA